MAQISIDHEWEFLEKFADNVIMMYVFTCRLAHEYVRAGINENLSQNLRCARRDGGIDSRATTREELEEACRRSGHRGHAEDSREGGSDGFGVDPESHDGADLAQHTDLQRAQGNGIGERDRSSRDQCSLTHVDVYRPSCLSDLELS